MISNKEIFIIRHGESVANNLKIACGQLDYPLSNKGILQSKLLCKELNKIKFDIIYCSKLKRAKQTLNSLKNRKIKISEKLFEINNGEFSKFKVNYLHKKYPKYKFQGLNKKLKYPGGESLEIAINRIWKWFSKESIKWKKKRKILIVGHELTVCAIIIKLLKLDLNNYPIFKINNCCGVKIIYLEKNQLRFEFINQ